MCSLVIPPSHPAFPSGKFVLIPSIAFSPAHFRLFRVLPNLRRHALHSPNLSSPKMRTGSYTLNLRICGSTSESGLPLTLIKPLPCLQCATAVAVFFLPKHWTDCTGEDIFAVDRRVVCVVEGVSSS